MLIINIMYFFESPGPHNALENKMHTQQLLHPQLKYLNKFCVSSSKRIDRGP